MRGESVACGEDELCENRQCVKFDGGSGIPADAGTDAGFDAGFDAGSGPSLSACVAQSASHSNCDAYCATVGRTCAEQCPQPNGAAGLFGAFAWPTSSTGCPGNNAGSASCSYDWGDSTPIQRWKCCCQ